MNSDLIRQGTKSPNHQMLGLYIHIPFCSSICNYCNFNRGLFEPALKARYVEALLPEIRRAGQTEATGRSGGEDTSRSAVVSAFRRTVSADTIYFGGGTPSLLEPAEIAGIIAACRDAFDVAADSE